MTASETSATAKWAVGDYLGYPSGVLTAVAQVISVKILITSGETVVSYELGTGNFVEESTVVGKFVLQS